MKLFWVSLVLIAAGCGPASDSAVSLPTTVMKIGNQSFILEKATTLAEQEKGLMLRDSLPADHGMIFIYSKPAMQRFWNHNVRFGLDNVFLDDGGTVVSIQHMNAYDEAGTTAVMARYIIELNPGVPAKVGIKVGDRLTIPADAINP